MPRCASNGSARIRRTVPGSFGEPRWPPVRLLPRCSSPPPVDVHILRQSATRAVGYPCTVQLAEAIGDDGAEPQEGWLLQYSGHAAAALARWATAGMTLQIDGCRYRCIRPAVAQAPRSETIRGNRRLVNAARGQRGAGRDAPDGDREGMPRFQCRRHLRKQAQSAWRRRAAAFACIISAPARPANAPHLASPRPASG